MYQNHTHNHNSNQHIFHSSSNHKQNNQNYHQHSSNKKYQNNTSNLSLKRQSFRKEIRRQQIQSYFSQKRKVLLKQNQDLKYQQAIKQNQQHNNNHQKQVQILNQIKNIQPIQYYLQQIIKQNNIHQAIYYIARLWQQQNTIKNNYNQLLTQSFKIQSTYQEYSSQICLRAVQILLKRAAPQLRSNLPNNNQTRVILLQTLSNIIIHQQCNGYLVYDQIAIFLKKQYGQFQKWKSNKTQTLQIGFMLGSLLKKNIFIKGSNFTLNLQLLKLILDWAYQIIKNIQDSQMQEVVLKGIYLFFQQVDQYYADKNSNLYNQSQNTLRNQPVSLLKKKLSLNDQTIEHFKDERLIFIQAIIKFCIVDKNVSLVILSTNFLNKNIHYLNFLDDEIIKILFNNLFTIIKQSLMSNKIFTSCLKFLILLLGYQKMLHIYLNRFQMPKQCQQVIHQLSLVEIPSKILILNFLNKIMIDQMMVKQIMINKLNGFLTTYLRDQRMMSLHNIQIANQVMLTVMKVFIMSQGQYGKQELSIIDSHIVYRNDQIGKTAEYVLKQCQTHF